MSIDVRDPGAHIARVSDDEARLARKGNPGNALRPESPEAQLRLSTNVLGESVEGMCAIVSIHPFRTQLPHQPDWLNPFRLPRAVTPLAVETSAVGSRAS